MDEVDAIPMPKKRRPKDSFQSELQSKLYQRRSQGLTAEITDSDDDMNNSPYSRDYQSSYSNRPGSAKRRPDRSPDLGRGLGTTTMRSRDLTQLLHQGTGYHDEEDDDDEEVMAANLGRSHGGGSWQTPSLKAPSPKQDPRMQRKTPTRESPKDSSRLDSIYGRHTPNRESPKEQSKLDSLYGRKTPTKDASPRTLTKEELIYGRKTPTSGDGRFPGMDSAKDKPWQPPNFRSVSPSSSTEHSRGSRGVTPIDSNLEPIDERSGDKMTPRLQRGERVKDDSPKHVSYGERPKPQTRNKFGERTSPLLDGKSQTGDRTSSYSDTKSPLIDRKSPYTDRKSPYTDKKSPLNERKSSYADRKSPLDERKSSYSDRKSPLDERKSSYTDRKSPLDERKSSYADRKGALTDLSSSKSGTSGMKRATPTYDLFGKSRSSAAQEVEDFIQADSKRDSRYEKRRTMSPEGRKTPTDHNKYQSQGQDRYKKDSRVSGSKEINQKALTGRKTPTSLKKGQDIKSPVNEKEYLKDRKSPLDKQSSLLDFLTGGQTEPKKPQTRKTKDKKNLDDEIDDMFGSNQKYLAGKSSNQYKSMYEDRKSPIDTRKPSLSNKKSLDDPRKSPDYLSKRQPSLGQSDREIFEQRKSSDMFEPSHEKQKRIPKPRKEDESSVCEEIPLDPDLQRAKAEQRALKSGKETTDRAKANHAIDSIAEAQTMKYIEPAKKVRPVTAEAKVQHRPKPRYGTLPGVKTQTLTEQDFNSTSDIRDAIYEQWYAERLKIAKKKKKEEDKKKQEEEEKKKKDELERKQEAQLSYKAWVDKKKEVLEEKAKDKRKELRKKHQEEQEKNEKQEEALKSFKHWKENKDAMIRHELHKKRRTEEEKIREKEDEDYRKRKERETAFRGWKSKKEVELREQQRQCRKEKENAKYEKEREKEEERMKEEEALKRYEEWMEAKEKQKKYEKQRKKQRLLSEEDDYKPAWSPANRTIPFGR